MIDTSKNKYSKLPIPTTSAWDKKSYDPIDYLYSLRKEWPNWIDKWIFGVYFNITTNIRVFFLFIKRLIKWIPVLWRDRDWDGYHIYSILEFKLLNARKHLVSSNRHTGIEEINRYITICLNLIDKLKEEYYQMEYLDYETSEFIFSKIDDKEQKLILEDIIDKDGRPDDFHLYQRLELKTISDNLLDYINKYPRTRDEVILQEKVKFQKDWSNYIENQEYRSALGLFMGANRQLKAKKLLFHIISEKIDYWWD